MMMTRLYKYISFWFFLAASMLYAGVCWAEEVTSEGLARPVMEYKAEKLRDPFKNYLTEEKAEPVPVEVTPSTVPQLDLTRFHVKGLIWGGRIPQAIINDQVMTIGDRLEGAEIVSIEKKGVTLSYNGAIYDLPAPGISSPAATPAPSGAPLSAESAINKGARL